MIDEEFVKNVDQDIREFVRRNTTNRYGQQAMDDEFAIIKAIGWDENSLKVVGARSFTPLAGGHVNCFHRGGLARITFV